MLCSELNLLGLDPVFQIIMSIYFDLAFSCNYAVVFVVAQAHNLVYLKLKLVPDVCLFFKLKKNKNKHLELSLKVCVMHSPLSSLLHRAQ